MVDLVYACAKFKYECGNYSEASEYLSFYRVLVCDDYLFLSHTPPIFPSLPLFLFFSSSLPLVLILHPFSSHTDSL